MSNKDNQLAEEHWAWLETLLHKVYVDAMIHGIKHGRQDRLIIHTDVPMLRPEEFKSMMKRRK